jgi:hypothetical protein
MPEHYDALPLPLPLPLPDPITQQIEIGLPLSTKQLDKIEQQFKGELLRIRREQEMTRFARIREERNNMVSFSRQVSSASPES